MSFKIFRYVLLIANCLLLIVFTSCKEEAVEFNANNCKGSPSFIKTLGFNPKFSFLSTSDQKTMGLLLEQSEQPGNPNARITKIFQHPSWKKGGWLAPILIDNSGNVFTSPAPFINILNNPIANNNTIYRVDAATGVMDEFLRLPFQDSINPQNPYGIIAMIYLCETGTLYVSSVAGSRLHKENGHIYAIDVKNKKIIDQLDHTDAMGMGITYATGKRQLFFGNGRNSDIKSITLNADGEFSGSAVFAFSLENLGPRGDDKVRRIRTDQSGNLIISGLEFNFNMIAPREKQETVYNFNYNEDEKKWIYKLPAP
jgi:outer membrane protein assembly factor BamB